MAHSDLSGVFCHERAGEGVRDATQCIPYVRIPPYWKATPEKKTYFSNSRVKILKNFCVKTPRRTVGSLNATVGVIKSNTLCVENYWIPVNYLTSDSKSMKAMV